MMDGLSAKQTWAFPLPKVAVRSRIQADKPHTYLMGTAALCYQNLVSYPVIPDVMTCFRAGGPTCKFSSYFIIKSSTNGTIWGPLKGIFEDRLGDSAAHLNKIAQPIPEMVELLFQPPLELL